MTANKIMSDALRLITKRTNGGETKEAMVIRKIAGASGGTKVKICAYEKCKKEFEPVHGSQRYCSSTCLKAHHKMTLRQRAAAVNNAARKDKIKPVRKPLTVDAKADTEQYKINMAVDRKYECKCEGRVVMGDEFQRLAQQYQERDLRGNLRLGLMCYMGRR